MTEAPKQALGYVNKDIQFLYSYTTLGDYLQFSKRLAYNIRAFKVYLS